MDASTPVWLLDVDGVLNADRPGWGSPPGQTQVAAGGAVYTLRWAPELMVRLTRLHRGRSVEIRWSTTWVDEIARIEHAFRLPSFPVAFTGPALGGGAGEAKETAALAVVEQEGRPLIWTDDAAIPESGPVRQRLAAAGQALLLIAPDPRRGLRPADLDDVAAFLAGRRRPDVARSEHGQ